MLVKIITPDEIMSYRPFNDYDVNSAIVKLNVELSKRANDLQNGLEVSICPDVVPTVTLMKHCIELFEKNGWGIKAHYHTNCDDTSETPNQPYSYSFYIKQ
ncbi:MAG: hypothetical protein H0X63_00050 [Flavobacteriales bacterium]|nr:hypothetical protein [Flavobacteriales bacterium]